MSAARDRLVLDTTASVLVTLLSILPHPLVPFLPSSPRLLFRHSLASPPSASAVVRKRAVGLIGALAPFLSDAQLSAAVKELLDGIGAHSGAPLSASAAPAASAAAGARAPALAGADRRTLIQTISTVSRCVGYRLGSHLRQIVPLLLSCLGSPAAVGGGSGGGMDGDADADGDAAHSDEANELRENVLQAFESFALRSPREMAPFVRAILESGAAWLHYDPNFMGGGGYGDAGAGGEGGFGGAEDGGDGGFGDDEAFDDGGFGGDYGDLDDGGLADEDDTSWKVRRAAVKLLNALVVSRAGSTAAAAAAGGAAAADAVPSYHEVVSSIGSELMSQFGDREETVRLEVIATLTELFRTASASGAEDAESLSASSASASGAHGVGSGDDLGVGEHAFPLGKCALAPVAFDAPAAAAPGAAASASGVALPRAVPRLVRQRSAFDDLVPIVPSLLPKLLSLLKERDGKSVKVRTAGLALLRTIVSVVALPAFALSDKSGSGRSAAGAAVSAIMASLAGSLGDRTHSNSQSLRLEACSGLRTLLLTAAAAAAASTDLAVVGGAAAGAAELLKPAEVAESFARDLRPVLDAASDPWYRLCSEALRTLAVGVTLMRPAAGGAAGRHELAAPALAPSAFDAAAGSIYEAVSRRLSASDIDQEVKECAVAAAAVLFAHAGDAPSLAPHLPTVLRSLRDRMRQESTRLVALRALSYLAASPLLRGDGPAAAAVRPQLRELAPEVAAFLTQISRPVKQQALHALACIIALLSGGAAAAAAGSGSELSPEVLRSSLAGAAGLLEEGDLQLLNQALRLACSVATSMPPALAGPALADTVLPRALVLCGSSSVQGPSLASLLSLLAACVSRLGSSGVAGGAFAFRRLLDAVMAAGQTAARAGSGGAALGGAGAGAAGAAGGVGAISTQAKSSIRTASKAAAALIANAPLAESGPVIAALLASSTGAAAASSPAASVILSLSAIGEAGRSVDVAAVDASAAAKLAALLTAAGDAGGVSEDVKSAAASALGGVCVGSTAAALPVLLSTLSSTLTASASGSAAGGAGSGSGAGTPGAATPGAVDASGAATDAAYQALSALRECLSAHAPAAPAGRDFRPYVSAVLPVLTAPAACGAVEEGVRNAVAECLGRVTAVDPAAGVPALLAAAASAEPHARWTAVAAAKHAASSPEGQRVLGTAAAAGGAAPLATLLALLADPALHVRGAAIATVASLAHAAPELLLPLLKPVPADRIPFPAPAASGAAPAGSFVYPAGSGAFLPPLPQPSVAADGVLAALYHEALPRADLLREVDLGPFKHTCDDGLPLRKAAFAALDTITASPALSDRVRGELVPVLCSGLRDAEDVKALTHGLVSRLVTMAGSRWQSMITEQLGPVAAALASAFDKVSY